MVMSQLEREPGEAIVDPWVSERATLVAIERERVVAAAHLLRYAAEERVSEFHRNLAEIRWLVWHAPNAAGYARRRRRAHCRADAISVNPGISSPLGVV